MIKSETTWATVLNTNWMHAEALGTAWISRAAWLLWATLNPCVRPTTQLLPYYLLFPTYYLLHTTYILLTTYYLLLTTYCSTTSSYSYSYSYILTTYYSLPPACEHCVV